MAQRVFAAENSETLLTSAAALDADPVAADGGGHVLWMAGQGRGELDDWLGAIQMAEGLVTFISPFQRALACGMEALWELPTDRVILAMDPGQVGHLCIFHGRALVLQRSFILPADPSEAEELIFEEVSRLLQFFKQKNRQIAFPTLHILGLPELSTAFQNRLQSSLRLAPSFLAPDLWPVLQEGLQRERTRKGGLNLMPMDLQEASQRRFFRNLVWGASIGMGLLLVLVSLFLFSQEAFLEREVRRADALLAAREARGNEELQAVEARLPLVRDRLAERHQAMAATRLGRLGLAIFTPPQGIQLEKVEILETAGLPMAHRFEINGLAFTEKAFSVGPLAQYLLALEQTPGVALEPVTEVSISDRVVAGREQRLDRMAITRFTLKGSAR